MLTPRAETAFTAISLRKDGRVVDDTAEALDGKSAVIEASAEAANLSDPVGLKIPVRFSTEDKSTFDVVAKAIPGSTLGVDFIIG